MTRNNERGVALILVLLVLALLATIVLQFDAEARRGIREAALFRDSVKAATLGQAGIEAARAILQRDQQLDEESGPATDGLTDIWARPIPSYQVGDGVLSGTIEDERGKFNVNDLAGRPDPLARQAKILRLKRLFALLQIDPLLVDAIADWVDADDVPEPNGAERAYYLALIPPYRPANGPLQSLGDLRLIKGFSDELVRRVSKYLTVYPLPADGWINLNTADPAVIQALHPHLTTAMVSDLVQRRPFRLIQDVDQVATVEPIAKELRLQGAYAVRSDHFSVHITATTHGVTKYVHAIIRRSNIRGADSVLFQSIQ
jgi:general secretion pathway protein K